MKFFIAFLLATCLPLLAQVPPYVRNEFDTNDNPTARNVVTQIVNGVVVGIITNSPVIARTYSWNFASTTNGAPRGQPFTNAFGNILKPKWSALTGSNVSGVVTGAYQLDTRVTSNLSVYLVTEGIPAVRRAVINYRITRVNSAGTVSPQFVFLIQTNSLDDGSFSPFLGQGAHVGYDGNGVGVAEINGGVGATLGSGLWNGSPISYPSGRVLQMTVEIDQPGGRLTMLGDNMRVTITNEVLKTKLAVGTNLTYLGFQIYAAGTTNISHLVEFVSVGVENQEASDAHELVISGHEGVVDIYKNNTVFGDNAFVGVVNHSNAVQLFGSSAGLSYGDRNAAAGDQNSIWTTYSQSGAFRWYRNDASLDILALDYNGYVPFLAPGADRSGVFSVGTTNRAFRGFFGGTNQYVGGQVRNSVGNTNNIWQWETTNGGFAGAITASGAVRAPSIERTTNVFSGTTFNFGTNTTIVTATNIYIAVLGNMPTDVEAYGQLTIVATATITITNLGALFVTEGGTNRLTSRTIVSGERWTLSAGTQVPLWTNGFASKN